MTFEEIKETLLKYLIEAEKCRYSQSFQKLQKNEKRRVIYLIEELKRTLEVLMDNGNE